MGGWEEKNFLESLAQDVEYGQGDQEKGAGSTGEIGADGFVGGGKVFFDRKRGNAHFLGGLSIGLPFELYELVGPFLLFGESLDGLAKNGRELLLVDLLFDVFIELARQSSKTLPQAAIAFQPAKKIID